MRSTLAIEEVDGRAVDDATAAALADLETATRPAAMAEDPPVVAGEVADGLRLAPAHEHQRLWLAREPSRRTIAGSALLVVEDVPHNRRLAYVDVAVRPEHRRRGLGSALLRPAVEGALARGRDLLIGDADEEGPGPAFGAALGSRTTLVERVNRLRTSEIDRALLDGWVARAAERATGYSLVAYENHCPDDPVDGLNAALAAMNDAPMPETMEPIVFRVEELRALERSLSERGTGKWTVLARHDASGEVAGLTELQFPRHRPWLAEQGDTGVLAHHRNRGLGRWLKAVNLLRLLDERPAVEVVDTGNASTNRAMLAINDALGFRQLVRWASLEVPGDEVLSRLDARA